MYGVASFHTLPHYLVSTIVLAAVVIVALWVVSAQAAFSQFVTGTIQLDQNWYTDNSVAQITVQDADANGNAGAIETVAVTIFSDQDPVGLTLTTTETGADTGEFTVNIRIDAFTTTPLAVPPGLLALNTQEIIARYTDFTPTSGASVLVSTTANVETGKPTFSSLLPPDGFSTQTQVPIFTGIINDPGGSGLDVSTILITIDGVPFAPVVTGSDGDSTVTFTFTLPALTANVDHAWHVSATDLAGNTGVSDADPDDGENDQDDHIVTVDTISPALLGAETGRYWDNAAMVEKSNKLDSLVVIFSEKMDALSITPADFAVEGVTPLAVAFGTSQTRVYLTLASDLAANAEPLVAIAAGGP